MEPGSGVSTTTRVRRMLRIAPQLAAAPGLAALTVWAFVVENWWLVLLLCPVWVLAVFALRSVWRRAETEGG